MAVWTNLCDSGTTPTSWLTLREDFNDTAASSVIVVWGGRRHLSAEEARRERERAELEKYLALLAECRARQLSLVRSLRLSERRPRPRRARAPERRPKARSTSGGDRWRVRNPNA
jgi:hypothetical protein